jgi:hypothetical protein
VRGFGSVRETITPHLTPLPMGDWIDMQRQKIFVLLQLFMLASSPSSCRRLHVGSISAPPDRLMQAGLVVGSGTRNP